MNEETLRTSLISYRGLFREMDWACGAVQRIFVSDGIDRRSKRVMGPEHVVYSPAAYLVCRRRSGS